MKLSQSHSLRQYQRLEEPSGFARGGSGRFFEGLPLEKYLEVAPELKIGYAKADELTYSDLPGRFNEFLDLYEVWRDSLIEGISETEIRDPLISPPVIDVDSFIADGNHRCAAASLNSPYVPAIIIAGQSDLDAVKKLVVAGILDWPHGFDYEGYIGKRDSWVLEGYNLQEFLDKMDGEAGNYGDAELRGIYFNSDHRTNGLLEHIVARVIHEEKSRREDRIPMGDRYFLPTREEIEIPYSGDHTSLAQWGKSLKDLGLKEIKKRIKRISRKSPIILEEGNFNLDDLTQESLWLIKRLGIDNNLFD